MRVVVGSLVRWAGSPKLLLLAAARNPAWSSSCPLYPPLDKECSTPTTRPAQEEDEAEDAEEDVDAVEDEAEDEAADRTGPGDLLARPTESSLPQTVLPRLTEALLGSSTHHSTSPGTSLPSSSSSSLRSPLLRLPPTMSSR